ncbi:MAG: septum formation initiator family protein [Patescibacteria group bacterium]|nr:septum formation initiator family protein [Patescibacteria group bacterium]MDE2144475.1 septum formation initiator family protein [Patescibacteria group bacterium]
MKRLTIYAVFITVLVIVAYQAAKLGLVLMGLDKQYSALKQENSSLITNNSSLEQEIRFYSDPYNLEKELRSKLNYILPGEKVIIIVPSTSTTSSQP